MRNPVLSVISLILVSAILVITSPAQPPSSRPNKGIEENALQFYALVNAVIVDGDRRMENATILIDGTTISAVGQDIDIPKKAKRIDLTDKVVYPGFIDAFSSEAVSLTTQPDSSPHWNELITPQISVARTYKTNPATNAQFRGVGFTTRLVAPKNGILKGQSTVVTNGDGSATVEIMRTHVMQHARLSVSRGRDDYPDSPMGAVALARQTFLDASWHEQQWRAFNDGVVTKRPERNDSLDALAHVLSGRQSIVFEAANEQYLLRADRVAREFELDAIILGSGREYRRLEVIKNTGRQLIIPISFSRPPNVGTFESALDVSYTDLMHWDHAPSNPAVLRNAGIEFAITSHDLETKSDFWKAMRKAVARGLDKQYALKSITAIPAKMLKVDHRVGKIAKGYLANLVVASGDLFENDSKVLSTWINGVEYSPESKKLQIAGNWKISTKEESPIHGNLINVTQVKEKITGQLSLKREELNEVEFNKITLRGNRLSSVMDGKNLGHKGVVQLSVVFTRAEGVLIGTGQITWPDGTVDKLTIAKLPDSDSAEDDDKAEEETEPNVEPSKPLFEINYPLGTFGVDHAPDTIQSAAFTNVTIWTCGPQGIIESGTVVIRDGFIDAVGADVKIPKDALIIDGQGMHLTPGIIDCHSHMATDGGVNEGTQAVTAEVRIGDFVDANDTNIFRQLAGGVPTSNILHGSANPIGGQNQVIKLRWGSLGEDMKFAEAPAGIKFALGENVKQSNWGDEYTTRYPQSRLGVEQIMRDTFRRAIQYQDKWESWNKRKDGPAPRRNLELDAIVQILNGDRWIHCHSYRQDEILALIRTLDKHDITIGTFQHVLEGYKVAPEMAKHGAMGSAFSDWWAYKYEVFDAIPYNGALMYRAGVVVSFNSDDRELARHLNHEAAKAIKYGDVPPEEALKFVTLNPAKQLRIDKYVGSIEIGKHADLVLWSNSPLSVFSRCEQTWIDGKKYFDRAVESQRRTVMSKRKIDLIQKVLLSGEAMLGIGENTKPEEELWPREDVFCAHGEHSHHQSLRFRQSN